MERFSKFKVLTIAFLLMFVFVVAAIYTNTKDATVNKIKMNQQSKNESIEPKSRDYENYNNSDNESSNVEIQNLTTRIDDLSRRIEEMRVGNSSQTENGMNCKIEGILSEGSIVPISSSEALQEAKVNNKEIVMTCSFR